MRITSFFLGHVAPSLEAFKVDNKSFFVGSGSQGSSSPLPEDEGFRLEMTTFYTEFCKIFENGMAKYLENDTLPNADLWRIIKNGVSDGNAGVDSMASMLVDLLDAVGR